VREQLQHDDERAEQQLRDPAPTHRLASGSARSYPGVGRHEERTDSPCFDGSTGRRAMRALRTVLIPVLLAGMLLSGCVAMVPGTAAPSPPAADPAAGGRGTPAAGGPWSSAETEAPGRDAAAESGRCRPGDGNGVLATIPLQHQPVDLVLDPAGSTLYTSSERGDVVSVVDTGSRAVVDTIRLRGRPHGLFLDAGTLYATLSGLQAPGGAIALVDTARREVVRSILFPDARWPRDAVVDPASGLLFVVNGGTGSVVVFHSRTGARVRSIPLGIDPVHVEVMPEDGMILVSGRKGLASIDAHSLIVKDVLDMPGGAMAVDHAAGDVFVANQGYGTLSVVDLAAFEVVGRVAVGGRGPFDVAFDADARLAYVTGAVGGEIALVDVATLRIVERIDGPDRARTSYDSVVVDHTTNCVFAADSSSVVVLERRS
jgi:YVTN family beta-propeller protein